MLKYILQPYNNFKFNFNLDFLSESNQVEKAPKDTVTPEILPNEISQTLKKLELL
jgi:hypothetical protein